MFFKGQLYMKTNQLYTFNMYDVLYIIYTLIICYPPGPLVPSSGAQTLWCKAPLAPPLPSLSLCFSSLQSISYSAIILYLPWFPVSP